MFWGSGEKAGTGREKEGGGGGGIPWGWDPAHIYGTREAMASE